MTTQAPQLLYALDDLAPPWLAEWVALADEDERLLEYNHNHDERGRFSTADDAVRSAAIGTKEDARPLLPPTRAVPDPLPVGYTWAVQKKYDTPEDARRACRAAIRSTKRERAYVIGNDGMVRYGVQGSNYRVEFGNESDLHAAHLVHSHPVDSGLSSADVKALFLGKARSVEAILPSGWVFRLETDVVVSDSELPKVLGSVDQTWNDTSWGWATAVSAGELPPTDGAWYAARQHVLKTVRTLGKAYDLRYVEVDPRGREHVYTEDNAALETDKIWNFQRGLLLQTVKPPAEPWKLREAKRGRMVAADDGVDWRLFFGPDALREAATVVNKKNRPLPRRFLDVAEPDQRAYEQAVRAATAAIGQMNEADRRRVLTVFSDYRDELLRALAAMPTERKQDAAGNTWEEFHLRQLLSALDNLTERFASRYHDAHMAGVLRSWRAGGMSERWALGKAGVVVPVQALSRTDVEAALRYSAALVRHVSDQTRKQLDGIIFASTLGHESPFDIQRKLARLLDPAPHVGTADPRAMRTGPGFARDPMVQAATVLRTEKGRLYSMSAVNQMRRLAESMPAMRKKWLHSGNPGQPREYHRDVLHGQIKNMEGKFNVNGWEAWGPHDPALPPGEVVNCFPPGTVVEGDIQLVLKSRYSGPIREFETSGGKRFAVTPNHPVLTPKGLVPAHALREGDHVLASRADVEAGVGSGPDYQHGPARVEDVFEAFAADGRAGLAVVAGLDLHGDAQPGDGYIEVVGANRELVLDFMSRFPQRLGNLPLVEPVPGPRLGNALVDRDGVGDSGFLGSLAPASAVVGRGDLGRPFGSVHPRPLPVGVELRAANRLANLSETASDYVPANPGRLSQGLDALAGPVAFGEVVGQSDAPPGVGAAHIEGLRPDGHTGPGQFAAGHPPADAVLGAELGDAHPLAVVREKIVGVRERDFSGHVYDVQTSSGLILAQGVIQSNCGCRVVPWHPGWQNRDTSGEREAIRQDLVDAWHAEFDETEVP